MRATRSTADRNREDGVSVIGGGACWTFRAFAQHNGSGGMMVAGDSDVVFGSDLNVQSAGDVSIFAANKLDVGTRSLDIQAEGTAALAAAAAAKDAKSVHRQAGA